MLIVDSPEEKERERDGGGRRWTQELIDGLSQRVAYCMCVQRKSRVRGKVLKYGRWPCLFSYILLVLHCTYMYRKAGRGRQTGRRRKKHSKQAGSLAYYATEELRKWAHWITQANYCRSIYIYTFHQYSQFFHTFQGEGLTD